MNSVCHTRLPRRGRGAYPSLAPGPLEGKQRRTRGPGARPSPKKEDGRRSRVSAVGKKQADSGKSACKQTARNTRPRVAAKQANTSQAVAAGQDLDEPIGPGICGGGWTNSLTGGRTALVQKK